MRSLTRHVKARWYWLLLAAAVAANVYGFVGFPNPLVEDLPEAQAHACPPNDHGCEAAHPHPPTTTVGTCPYGGTYPFNCNPPPTTTTQPSPLCPPHCIVAPPPVVVDPPVVDPPVVDPPVVDPPVVVDPVGAGNSAVVVDLPRWGPMLSSRVPNLVPIPGPGWSAKPLVSAHDRIMGTHRRVAAEDASPCRTP